MIHNMVVTTDGFSIPTSIGSAEVFSHQQDTISGNPNLNPKPKNPNPSTNKKKRNLPGTPDPDSEVIALSPKTLMATNRFICEICNKGFQRDQNLQLHRRGHNLPWKLKQRTNKEPVKRKVYVCPEKTCVHHDPSRALGDLTGIKKHFSRKHGEKKWKCEKCSKKYAVQSDWKAHSKTCGTREYKCDCGTLFSRKDSFITHRAFCDALAEDSARFTSVGATNLNFGNDMLNNNNNNSNNMINIPQPGLLQTGFNVCQGVEDVSTISPYSLSCFRPDFNDAGNNLYNDDDQQKPRLSIWLNQENSQFNVPKDIPISNSNFYPSPSNSSTTHNVFPEMVQMTSKSCSIPMSATALLQKAAQMGSTRSNPSFFGNTCGVIMSSSSSFSINNNIVGDVLPLVSTTSSNLMSSSLLLPNSSNSTFNNIGKANDISSSSSSLFSLNQLTRDFLGVGAGGDNSQRQYLPQQLAKFANSMGLSQFTTNH